MLVAMVFLVEIIGYTGYIYWIYIIGVLDVHQVRINAFPTKSKTSRRRRAEGSDRLCRTGCNAVETTTHVVQVCYRTHGGRVKRHDAVSKTLAAELRQKRWKVRKLLMKNCGLWGVKGNTYMKKLRRNIS